jgi:hypothetical protein
MTRFLKLASAISWAATLVSSQSHAAIRCDGNYQIIHGKELSTPFCEDEDLAAWARGNGLSISSARIRQSADAKHQACLWTAGASTSTCANYLGD